MKKERPNGIGLGVDAGGGPVVDPTANVIALSKAATERQDDLREEFIKYVEAGLQHVKEMVALRAEHAKELRTLESENSETLRRAEAARLDSIRQVDREDVNKTAAQVLNSVQTLATTTTTTAETLRNQVATTALQAATQRAQDQAETNKRLSAVELALSEGKGKQTVADPALVALAANVERLANAQAGGAGRGEGADRLWRYIAAGLGVFLTVMMLMDRFAK